MARHNTRPFLALQIVWLWAWCCTGIAANAAEFYAIVEPDGTVALCLAKGALLFPDRCAGRGRLTIVQPINEGPVVWRSATGTVTLDPPQDPDCARSRAKWDRKTERVVATGQKITKADPAA